jgi:hypothetical protein
VSLFQQYKRNDLKEQYSSIVFVTKSHRQRQLRHVTGHDRSDSKIKKAGFLHAVFHDESGSLGKDAKYVDQFADKQRKENRKALYQMQRRAAWLLPEERVGNCRWTVQRLDRPVELTRHSEGHASYAGLQTCGSVWSCPICAKRVSEQRRSEMNHVLSWAREQKHRVKMLTLTSRHTRADLLADQLSSMKRALRLLRQRREWRKLKTNYLVGSIVATEITHGRNGWHTHFHIILILKDECDQLLNGLQPPWMKCLNSCGLSGQSRYAFNIQDAHKVGEYISKWGAAEEMVLAHVKKGGNGGRNPFQLLRDFTFDRDIRAGELFKEFSKVFKGTRQLIWSDGLKQFAGVDEIDDGEAAAGEDQQLEELVAFIDHREWVGDGSRKGVRTRRLRVLEAAERSAEAARLQISIGLPDDEPEDSSVLDDDPPFIVNTQKTVFKTVREHIENHSEQENEHGTKFKPSSGGSITF